MLDCSKGTRTKSRPCKLTTADVRSGSILDGRLITYNIITKHQLIINKPSLKCGTFNPLTQMAPIWVMFYLKPLGSRCGKTKLWMKVAKLAKPHG
ncbi:hypothetical protein Hanom_Chr12g01101841 [Helianthus anomalus]